MEALDVINRALAELQETIDEFYTTTNLYYWLNDGQLEFIDVSGVYKQNFSITTVAGTACYSFPTALLRPERVWYDEDTKLKAADLHLMDEVYSGWKSADAGTPEVYFEPYNRTLQFHPKPDTSGKVITVLGVSAPTTVTSEVQTLSVPLQFQSALVEYMKFKMLRTDKQEQEALHHYQLFLSKAKEARMEARKANRPDRRYSSFPAYIIK